MRAAILRVLLALALPLALALLLALALPLALALVASHILGDPAPLVESASLLRLALLLCLHLGLMALSDLFRRGAVLALPFELALLFAVKLGALPTHALIKPALLRVQALDHRPRRCRLLLGGGPDGRIL